MTVDEYIKKAESTILDLKKNNRHVLYDLSVEITDSHGLINNITGYFNSQGYGCDIHRCKLGKFDITIWW